MDYKTIIYIVIIAILFLIVQRYNRNNKNKLYGRKGRNFRENFMEKRKAAEDQSNQTEIEK